jgi:cation diffusion facilitator family transporter
VAKATAAAITGSSAMLAEALHSVADSVNEVLLLVGARRAGRPADLRHPFGHARYRFLYAFVVSLAVFWLGGVLSVIEGVNHVVAPARIGDSRWAFGVLAFAAVLDGWSLRTTIRAWQSAKGERSWRRLLRDTKAPELIVVFLEDVGAIIGVAFAAVGVTLTAITGEGAWDAIASIAIGLLLMTIGLLVNRETQSLLVGEAAAVDVVAAPRGHREHRGYRRCPRATDDPHRARRPRRGSRSMGRSRTQRRRDHPLDRRGQAARATGGSVPHGCQRRAPNPRRRASRCGGKRYGG